MDIRQAWLDYYTSEGYDEIPGTPLVHPAFPTSFNISAGLVQLDPTITDETEHAPIKRCLVQKCIRNFDIDKVGDRTHLSFFEMPAAFEIGQINPIKTIENFWRFFTVKLHLDPKRIWITTMNEFSLYSMEVSHEAGVNEYLQDLVGNRLVIGNEETNFWTQGGGIGFLKNIRLCGPQIEIFYSFSDKNNPVGSNPINNPQDFMEMGPVIDIKYVQDNNNHTARKLLNHSIEAVFGLERVSSIAENCPGNLLKTPYFISLSANLPTDVHPRETQIMLDHLKALLFIFSEEIILPGQSYRNHIVKTLIRTLFNTFYLLNLNPRDYLSTLSDRIISLYKLNYPEIEKAKDPLLKMLNEHEIIYKNTLDEGKGLIVKYLRENNRTEPTTEDKIFFKEHFGIRSEMLPFLFKSE